MNCLDYIEKKQELYEKLVVDKLRKYFSSGIYSQVQMSTWINQIKKGSLTLEQLKELEGELNFKIAKYEERKAQSKEWSEKEELNNQKVDELQNLCCEAVHKLCEQGKLYSDEAERAIGEIYRNRNLGDLTKSLESFNYAVNMPLDEWRKKYVRQVARTDHEGKNDVVSKICNSKVVRRVVLPAIVIAGIFAFTGCSDDPMLKCVCGYCNGNHEIEESYVSNTGVTYFDEELGVEYVEPEDGAVNNGKDDGRGETDKGQSTVIGGVYTEGDENKIEDSYKNQQNNNNGIIINGNGDNNIYIDNGGTTPEKEPNGEENDFGEFEEPDNNSGDNTVGSEESETTEDDKSKEDQDQSQQGHGQYQEYVDNPLLIDSWVSESLILQEGEIMDVRVIEFTGVEYSGTINGKPNQVLVGVVVYDINDKTIKKVAVQMDVEQWNMLCVTGTNRELLTNEAVYGARYFEREGM